MDRAANKHRFLIVKRRDDVDDSTNETETEQTADESASDAEPIEDSAAAGNGVDEVDAPEPENEEAETTAPIAVVAEALERLTDAVELMGTLDEAEAKARIAELAGELRRLTEQLAGLSGDEPTTPGEVGSIDETGEASQPSESEAIDERPTDPEIRVEEPPQPSTELRDQIQALAEELRILVGTVKEQQQRISRLEKRSGLPNSAPPGERRRVTKDDADVSWPFDLNRDRGSDHVDQSISFHDE